MCDVIMMMMIQTINAVGFNTDIVLITTLMVPRDAKGKDLNVFVYSTSSVLSL